MKRDYVSGIIIILLGVFFLLTNLGIIDVEFYNIWPLLLLLPGIIFELSYFVSRKNPGLLVPGGILTTYGLLFYINIRYGWYWLSYLWPLFLLGVAIGLFQLYIFGERDKELLIPVGILGGLSAFFLLNAFYILDFTLIISIALIIIGLIIILRKK
ncbi:MAG: hypothetical protein FH753_10830 [Firmicutes bacterium]|nr:hypothetical protein [Bacillota bacterium]